MYLKTRCLDIRQLYADVCAPKMKYAQFRCHEQKHLNLGSIKKHLQGQHIRGRALKSSTSSYTLHCEWKRYGVLHDGKEECTRTFQFQIPSLSGQRSRTFNASDTFYNS